MLDRGESRKEVIQPDFNRAIMIDFQGAMITSDVGFLLMREIDDRFKIIDPRGDCLEGLMTKFSITMRSGPAGIGIGKVSMHCLP